MNILLGILAAVIGLLAFTMFLGVCVKIFQSIDGVASEVKKLRQSIFDEQKTNEAAIERETKRITQLESEIRQALSDVARAAYVAKSVH
jgi:hypothetical protein